MLERWTRAVVRRRRLVLALWAALVVAGLLASQRLPGLLSTSLAVPGTSSQKANAILQRHFGEDIEGTFTVVLPVEHLSPKRRHALGRELARAVRAVPTAHATAWQSGAGILFSTVDSSLDLQRAASYTGALRRALGRSDLGSAYVTGAPALQHDVTPVLASDLHRGELIALLSAALLLLIVLGLSAAVLVPLLVAACTTIATLGIVYLLAHELLMVLYIPNVVELIGLGLAVDYSLLIVHRFREELADKERPLEDALVATMTTAGRTVLLSGLAVALGLSLLLLIPVPFLGSLGLAGVLVPVVSIVAAFTLQPALLGVLGRRGVAAARLRRSEGPRRGGRLWPRLAATVVRRRLLLLACSAALLAAAIVPVCWLELTPASVTAIPQSIPSARGLTLLREHGGPGLITPIEVVLEAAAPHEALAPAVSAASLRLARQLLADPRTYVVAIGTRPPYVDPSGRYRQMIVVGRDDFGAPAMQALVGDLRGRLVPAAHFPAGDHVYVGGAPAQGVDFLAAVYGAFPWVLGLVLALSYLVLLRAFRSLLLPLLAILLDAVSVAAAYGLLVVVFRFGVGADLFGLYRVSQIEGWVPVFLFAALFGLSMDYEVFLVSRMREEWRKGAPHEQAVTDGLARTGRVVSAAALIMVGALAGLAFGRVAGLQELGVGLALGVLLEASVVRGVVLPALMAACGEWSWWLPRPVARVLRVTASPLSSGERRGRLLERST